MYQTLASPSRFTFEEKRSEFIAHIYPVTSRDQAMISLKALKIEYPDARHHCWAYIIGDPQQPKTVAFNDDGEPSGTAGKPILHVLTQRAAGDCCAIVVRYFGGVKLGAGGLVRAYGQAVSKALDIATWRQIVPQQRCTISLPYEHEALVRHLLERHEGVILDQKYDVRVQLTIEVASQTVNTFKQQLIERTSGQTQLIPLRCANCSGPTNLASLSIS